MNTLRKYRKILGVPVVAAVMVMQMPIGAANAAMVGTDEIVPAQTSQDQLGNAEARARVDAMLEREDVQSQLRAWGVSPDEAKRRVATLSDAEIASLAARIGDDPSGQGVVGTLLIIAIVAVIVLVITDLAGATDVFPFINSRSERR